MAKKQRIWKPKLFRLGLLLTLGVIAADWGPVLTKFENILYDVRAKRCQLFTPPPTDRIVHIDIDNDSLNEVGHWPWPRQTLAKILDEVALAKPKVIGFDIYFSEPEKNEGEVEADNSIKLIRHDDLFADSIKRAGNVLLPISVQFTELEKPDPIFEQVRGLLETNLEMSTEQVVAALKDKGLHGSDMPQQVQKSIALAREDAMMSRLGQEIQQGVTDEDTLNKRLCPIWIQTDIFNDAARLLHALYPRMMAVHQMQRFCIPVAPDAPLCICPSEAAVNIQKFTDVIRYSGFIDLPPSTFDGAVRTVPLLVNYRGKVLPHMALSMACALLDVDPKDIRYTQDQIILPVPQHEPIIIPCRTERSATLGQVGAMVDIPYFGRGGEDGWLTMYDFPRYQEAVAHIKIGNFWALLERRNSVETNNGIMDQILKDLSVRGVSVPESDSYIAHVAEPSDTATRLKVIDALFKQLADLGVTDLMKKPATELDADDKALVQRLTQLQTAANESRETGALLTKDRLNLQHQLQGKAVFIDWTAQGGGDRYPTALHPNCPGGVIQGTILNGILTRDLWTRAPRWVTVAITLLVGLLTTILVALLPPWRALFCTLLVMLAYALINGIVLFDYGNLIVGAAGPLTACALVWGGLTLTDRITERREKARIRRMFTNYIDPAIVNYYEDHPEKVGVVERRDMTVVFTDLAGFTTISEKLGESTVGLLNKYFGKMVPVIRDNKGVVNKFLGDGLMFFFNAPEDNPSHAADAVQSILDMRKVLEGFNQSLAADGLPPVGMRAGMTTGYMVVGDAGSKAEDEKNNANDFTVLGDKVNLAARLEGANKVFGSNLLMNQETRDGIGDRFLCRKIGKIQVKGKSEYVMCHEAICTLAEATPEQTAQAGLCTEIVDVFQAGEFDRCVRLCEDLEARFKDADFAEAYRDECDKHLRKAFKGTFAGQIVLSEK